jgi:WD40 repeat protein
MVAWHTAAVHLLKWNRKQTNIMATASNGEIRIWDIRVHTHPFQPARALSLPSAHLHLSSSSCLKADQLTHAWPVLFLIIIIIS